MRKWSARQNEREKEFHLCISLSLLQNIKISHFLSQNIGICHFLSRNVKIRYFLSRMLQKSKHTRYEEMILDQIRLRGSPASCASLLPRNVSAQKLEVVLSVTNLQITKCTYTEAHRD